jgi:hypothetical protein
MDDPTYWAFADYMRDELREAKRAANKRRR